MASFLDFTPLFTETVDTIRARVNADLNAGLAPTDAGFTDLTPGSIAWDLTQAPILEIERLYETLNELAAAMFPVYAWGTYLDEHAATIGLVRKDAVAATGTVTFTGTPGTLIGIGYQVATPQTDPNADPITFETTASGTIPGGGTLDLAVQAVVTGGQGNVAANSITVKLTPNDAISSLTNAAATSGGADIETDEQLRDRVLIAWSGAHGSGTIADYEQWALAYPGVGFVTVQPLWAGAGTVRVVISDVNHQPVSAAVVAGLQTELDPVAGQGQGLAPVGASVTVATTTLVSVAVAATMTLASGYTLDGTSGTIAVRSDLDAAISAYLLSLDPGSTVILQHVVAVLFTVAGVVDVASVQLNGGTSNVTLTSLQTPQAGTITLT